ncbi:MAG: hypothetical protein RMJ07_05915 [Nitrososphaerota archaeon]|nr:hypothetical protein [Candidatus Bathyarchaeota archaeon]MDW8049195.1 hypothetical protein [Nitrososphaerota archaeon]
MYDELINAWRNEKEKTEIQPLEKNFYSRIAEYIKRIREERRMLDDKTLRGRLMEKEEEYVKRMVEDLIRTRYEKIMNASKRGEIVPTSILTEEEEILYQGLASQIESFQNFLKNLLQGRVVIGGERERRKMLVVRFLKDTPEIVGVDMKVYGPFKPEDVASLPLENAKLLVKQGIAVEIESKY